MLPNHFASQTIRPYDPKSHKGGFVSNQFYPLGESGNSSYQPSNNFQDPLWRTFKGNSSCPGLAGQDPLPVLPQQEINKLKDYLTNNIAFLANPIEYVDTSQNRTENFTTDTWFIPSTKERIEVFRVQKDEKKTLEYTDARGRNPIVPQSILGSPVKASPTRPNNIVSPRVLELDTLLRTLPTRRNPSSSSSIYILEPHKVSKKEYHEDFHHII